jgi:hypothetical protein
MTAKKTTGRHAEHLMDADLRYYLGLSRDGAGADVRHHGLSCEEYLSRCEAHYRGPISGPWTDEDIVKGWIAGTDPADVAADASYRHERRKANRSV